MKDWLHTFWIVFAVLMFAFNKINAVELLFVYLIYKDVKK